jgi:hypothetical protein
LLAAISAPEMVDLEAQVDVVYLSYFFGYRFRHYLVANSHYFAITEGNHSLKYMKLNELNSLSLIYLSHAAVSAVKAIPSQASLKLIEILKKPELTLTSEETSTNMAGSF